MKRRDWLEAVRKIEREGCCRVCGSVEMLQAAHTIGRARQDIREGSKVIVKGDAVVPLCEPCHRAYDAREVDLLPYLHLHEQVFAVESAGGLVSAYKRLTGERP